LDYILLWIDTAWIIRSFQNIDKVSCYANVVLQCLLSLLYIYNLLYLLLYIFRKKLLNYDKFEVLNLFAHRYEMNNLNTYEIRQSLREYFSVAIKRD